MTKRDTILDKVRAGEMTQAEAARELGITPGRITMLLADATHENIVPKASPELYAKHRVRLGLDQIPAGKLFGIAGRTAQQWAKDGPPLSVIMVMALCDSAEDIRKLAVKVSKQSES